MPTRPSPSAGHGPDFRKPEMSAPFENTPISRIQSGAVSDSAHRPFGVDSPMADASPPVGQSAAVTAASAFRQDVSSALTYGLELVRYGAMLVANEGNLRIANRAALSILEKKDGLWIGEPGLVAERASDTRLLLRLLREAISIPEQGEPKDSPIMLPRKAARTSLIVRVVPGPDLNCWPNTENRAAMLMLYDQDMGVDVNISLLIKLYGLTRGEAALAAHLMRGKSIEEAAHELFISPHTARTHLKRIFMKTDTHRQTELVVRISPAIL
jgi:DNA-binding CsgD family transcriptional regulator